MVGGVVGSRHKGSSSVSSAAAVASASAASASAVASAAASAKVALGRFPSATDSFYMIPVYPSTTDSVAFSSPTFVPTSENSWPKDSFQPSTPDVLTVRPDRPRLIAPAYKWAALPNLIANDPYLQLWNETIFKNASDYKSQVPVVYFLDGDSGILDNAREIKQRIKAFAYVYRMTNDSSWVDRAWEEIQVCARIRSVVGG